MDTPASPFRRWPARLRRLVCLLAFCAGAVFPGTLGGRELTAASEEQVRAAFLFQLAQYVHWPSDAFGKADSPLRFCVFGQDKLRSILEGAVSGKKIQGRTIAVLIAADPGQLAGCHLAFLGVRSEKQIRDVLNAWRYPPVLLVGEADRFAEFGGMVNLVIQSGRVSFEINVTAAERARLEFRSQLLRFARIVPDKRPEHP